LRYFALNNTDHRTHEKGDTIARCLRWHNARATLKRKFTPGSVIRNPDELPEQDHLMQQHHRQHHITLSGAAKSALHEKTNHVNHLTRRSVSSSTFALLGVGDLRGRGAPGGRACSPDAPLMPGYAPAGRRPARAAVS
jgi:hypothetical protein